MDIVWKRGRGRPRKDGLVKAPDGRLIPLPEAGATIKIEKHRAEQRKPGKRRIGLSVASAEVMAKIVELRTTEGLSYEAIGLRVGLRKSYVGELINRWEEQRGEPVLKPLKPKRAAATNKRGGRSKYRRDSAAEQYAAANIAVEITGIVPLDEALRIIARHKDNPAKESVVLEAIRIAAPYMHARLAPIETTGHLSLEQIINRLTREQLFEFAAGIRAALAAEGNRAEAEGAGTLGTGPGEPGAAGSIH